MKSGRVFWGTLFVIIGLLGILHNFFNLAISWDALWKLWPLLLVFLGISAFLKDSKSKWIVIGGIGLLAGVVIFASVQRGCSSVDRIIYNIDDNHGTAHYSEQELNFHYDTTAAMARFYFEGGAGHFEMGDTTSEFVSASVRSNVSEYMLDYEAEDMPTFRLHMADESVSWRGSKMRNHVMMRLHPDPLWDVNIDAGAAKIEFDLRPYRIGNLDVDAGAASIEIRLGSRADTSHVRIETGASSVHLYVPTGVGCELRTESALSSKHVHGFVSEGDGFYRSENFGDNPKRIFISVESGLSSITVDRYDAETW
ncbi:MAG: hypothetical protein IH600_15900 [Bacteroidetes bacterium]|nr:hypothetical protein [Bacteroidota bacterium]